MKYKVNLSFMLLTLFLCLYAMPSNAVINIDPGSTAGKISDFISQSSETVTQTVQPVAEEYEGIKKGALGNIESSKFINDLKNTYKDVKGKVDDIKEVADDVKGKVDDVKGKVDDAKDKIKDGIDQVNEYKGQAMQLKEKATSMAQELKAKKDSLANEAEAINERSQAIKQEYENYVKGQEAEYDAQIKALQDNNAELEKMLSENTGEKYDLMQGKAEVSKKVPVKFGERGTSGVATEKAKALEKDVMQEKKADKLQEDNELKSSNSEKIKAVQNALTSANAMSKDLPSSKAKSSIKKAVSGASKVAPSKMVKDKALAIDKKINKNEPVSGISTPSRLFKKSSQNNEVLNTKIATYRQKFVFSFAAEQQDKSNLDTYEAMINANNEEIKRLQEQRNNVKNDEVSQDYEKQKKSLSEQMNDIKSQITNLGQQAGKALDKGEKLANKAKEFLKDDDGQAYDAAINKNFIAEGEIAGGEALDKIAQARREEAFNATLEAYAMALEIKSKMAERESLLNDLKSGGLAMDDLQNVINTDSSGLRVQAMRMILDNLKLTVAQLKMQTAVDMLAIPYEYRHKESFSFDDYVFTEDDATRKSKQEGSFLDKVKDFKDQAENFANKAEDAVNKGKNLVDNTKNDINDLKDTANNIADTGKSLAKEITGDDANE